LQEARLWLSAIAETSSDAIIGKDINGAVTSWNNAATAMFGYTADEIIGQSITAIIPPERMSEEASILDRIRRGEKVAYFETMRYRKDGTAIPVSLTVSPIRDHQNKIIGVLKIARDLSEMQSIRRQLEEREALLQQAQKMEAIGGLAAGVAHDFNNILQSIVGALELVLDDVAAGTPARKFTEVAINAAVRGASITHHMLSYARKQLLRPKMIELRPFLHDIQRLLSRTLGPHIAVTIQLDGNPSMLADPGQLQTALLNLAINGAHAMPRGGTLSIRACEETEVDQPWAVVVVTDTGVGMDEATRARSVEPFFTTKGLDGSGLGLSMVSGFAEQSGGKLLITSTLGQGTTVKLSMPSNAPDQHDEQHWVLKDPQAHCRILLVDDLTDVLSTLTAILAKAGFEVTPADSGNQALAILAADGPFDVLITDFAMPGMNGAELITRCRAIQPGLRVAVITGFAELGFVEALPQGTDVLRKPIQRKDLIATVHRLMASDHDGARGTVAASSGNGASHQGVSA
jgi:PAS domain S-box-containing protein